MLFISKRSNEELYKLIFVVGLIIFYFQFHNIIIKSILLLSALVLLIVIIYWTINDFYEYEILNNKLYIKKHYYKKYYKHDIYNLCELDDIKIQEQWDIIRNDVKYTPIIGSIKNNKYYTTGEQNEWILLSFHNMNYIWIDPIEKDTFIKSILKEKSSE